MSHPGNTAIFPQQNSLETDVYNIPQQIGPLAELLPFTFLIEALNVLLEQKVGAKMLEDLAGKAVHNISRPGISIQELIFQIFAYFKTFGNPDTLICLFPDPYRMQVPVKKNLITVGDNKITQYSYGPNYTLVMLSEISL